MTYDEEYSEESFWNKVKEFSKKAGGKVIYLALLLYYAAKRPETPVWAKGTMLGALGYFISPIDAIPDFTPIIGYSDDLGVLVLAVTTCAAFINDSVKREAREKITEWFGKDIFDDIQEVDLSLNK